MANWFKLYETDLDETRLKYALNKLPEVGWVWIGILSECCKHRSDTIRWSDREHELFGFSDRLKVSIPKINEAINLLNEIEYIEKQAGFIKVLKWNDKQSEYCVRKSRGDYDKSGKHPIVSDNIGESPLEEKRGEQSKGEERDKAAPLQMSPLVKEVFDAWNSQTTLPHCLVLSDKRRRSLEARSRDGFFKSNWKAALKKASESKFCQGESERGWKASFDWFLQPDSCAKIMEGKYDSNTPSGNGPTNHRRLTDQELLDEATR